MKKLWKLMVTFALVTTLAIFIFPAPTLAIQNGSADGTNHPYVCLVVFYDSDDMPLWRTTGELLSSKVVLTAGHGTFGTVGARVWFLNQIPASAMWPPPYTTARPEAYPYGGPDAYSGTPYTISSYRSVPNPGLPGFDYHDVGVVVLDKSAPVTQYAQLPTVGLVDNLPMKNQLDLVGYGVTSQQKGGGVSPYDSWTWNRQRNYAPSNLIQSKDILSSEFLKLTANPGQDKGGMTFGDSGGPILNGGTDVILGINTFVTNSNCSGVSYAQRIDIPDILAWINGPH